MFFPNKGARFFSQGQSIQVQPGDILFLTENLIFSLEPLDSSGLSYIQMSLSKNSPFHPSIKRPMRVFKVNCDLLKNKMRRSLYNLLESIECDSLCSRDFDEIFHEICETLSSFIAKDFFCMEAVLPKTAHHDLVFKALQLMSLELSQAKVISKIARKAKVSSSYLSRIFKKDLQLSPSEGFHLLKIKRAQFLIEKEGRISTVTYNLGYSDQSHFSKAFKSVFLMTPSQYKSPDKKIEAES